MGKFIATKFSAHQQRVVKKRPAKSTAEKVQPKKARRAKHLAPKAHNAPNEEVEIVSEIEDPNGEFQNLNIEIATNPNSGKKHLVLVKPEHDLFAIDELNSSYDQYTKYNLIFIIFDEIALEGLDGITIETYWKRLQTALALEILPCGLKQVIWQIICLNDEIKFFRLPEARESLLSLNKETSSFLELYDTSPDIYKVEQAPKSSGEWGSCSNLLDRVDISEAIRQISLEQAEATYQNELVLVADEELRKNALFDDLMDPNYEFTPIEYCLLERIGRGRKVGEVTLGPKSLPTSFKLDPKSVYHYCKRLNKEYLVSRQYGFVSFNLEQTKVGRLFHLRRFYQRKKSKYLLIVEGIINYLKKCPGYRAPYATVRSLFDFKASLKIFKHSEFLKHIDTNIYVPFKEYYTEATFKQYMTKNMTRERIIQLMQLKDPYMNISACWVDGQNADSSDDEDEDRECDVNSARRIYNKDSVRDVYQFIVSRGLAGVGTREVNDMFDMDFSAMRSILKKLTARKLVQPKKRDVGKQTVNQYVATSLLQAPQLHITQPRPVETGSSSALEKLKQSQKRKIDSLSKDRVYSAEQYEADREDQLLRLNAHPLPAAALQIPQIVCRYLIAELRHSQNIAEFNVLLVQMREAFEPFRIRLTLPILPNNHHIHISNLKEYSTVAEHEMSEIKYVFKDPPEELSGKNFRPDNFSKAFLMQALLDKVRINKTEIINFLDTNKPPKRAEKRPIEAVEVKAEAGLDERRDLGMYMGSNPQLVLAEKDDTSGISMEIHVSTPVDGDYKTGDITEYTDDPSILTTERVLSRMFCVLRTVQERQIVEEMNFLVRIICKEESESGYDRRIDRKSLHRIFKRLTNEGYIKIFSVNLITPHSQKTQTFVCHPKVEFSHPLIQESLRQFKEKQYCYMTKDVIIEPVEETAPPKRSPFIEADVLKSIKEIKALTPTTAKAKSCRKSGKFYGRRPKFARLSLIHELLFYLIYELDKNTQPLAKSEVAQMFNNYQIKLSQAELQNLPPVYCREISWKTFIPPLPYHDGWDEGWALLVDVILRFPLILVTRCYSVNFVSAELQEILQHPIKRFYLLRDVSPNIRMIILYRRKFVLDMYGLLVLLSYCGLAQFGPSSFRDKEKSFFYLNRRATLWDTTTSTPSYQKIEDKDYKTMSFYFNSMSDVLSYWSTMNNICINTNLATRRFVQGKTITLVDSSAKPSMMKARAIKTCSGVEESDTGELPGDHRGAAGLDSSLWSHVQRSWYFFATKDEPSFTESLDTLKIDQVANNKVSYDELKLIAASSRKYYIAKPPNPKHALPLRKVKPSRPGKGVPIVKRTVPVIRRKPPDEKKEGLDATDKATMRRLGTILRYRPTWTEREDRLLILLKIASTFITPGTTKQIISYGTLRDVLHVVEPKCRDKTTRSISNRLKMLQKSVPFLANIESLLPNLYKLVPMAKYFVPFRKFVLHGVDKPGFNRKYKLSDPELHNAFLFLVQYFLKHRTEVEVSLHGKNTRTDYFNEENVDFFARNIEPFETKIVIYTEPRDEVGVRKYTLRNTIQSALRYKGHQQGWSLQMYKIYQRFSEHVLKTELNDLKNCRMIQSKKDPARTFLTPYRLSWHYVSSQSCTFSFHTMEEAYNAFLDLKYNPNDVDYSFEAMEEKKYGQMFGLNEVLSFMLTNATIQLAFPEHHLILNPNVEDHSDVIDELAQRYQANLRSEQKDTEPQAMEFQTSAKIEDEDIEMSKPLEPGPSTAAAAEEPEFEIIPFDDDEPLDLSITAKDSTTIDNLKHWISDCIDSERVRSPSPELLNLDVNQGPEANENVETASQPAPLKEDDRVLTLEEIKEEMLKLPTDTTEKRLVPYISDLTKLLSVNFEEIEFDERASYLMKKHFVQRYPALEKVTVDGLETHYLSEFLENRSSINDIWVRAEREAYVDIPSDAGIAFDGILEKGGNIEDVSLAQDMISYIENKEFYGATGYDLKEQFSASPSTCSLEMILQILLDRHILLRTGVCAVRFVHHNYQNSWLTDTFKLTPEQAKLFSNDNTSGEALQKLEADIKSVNITQWIKIKPMPWVAADGSLDKDMLKMWLSQVFSYCIENPKCPMMALCDKFSYLKPVDVFYLVELLEEIGALEMRRLPAQTTDLFSEYEHLDDCKATLLDRMEEIYVEPNNISFITVGSFLHSL